MSLATPERIRRLQRELSVKANTEPTCGDGPRTLTTEPVGEPDAANAHVRFDGRDLETEP